MLGIGALPVDGIGERISLGGSSDLNNRSEHVHPELVQRPVRGVRR